MGKTITTYFIDGTPQGPRMVYVSNKNCMAIVVPRSKMADILNRKELQKYALYILMGESDEGETKAYIGEGSGSSLINIVRQFRSLQGLHHNRDERYTNFKQYFEMPYNCRNEDTHTAPVLDENQLPAAIHILVAMYDYATMISVTDIEHNLSWGARETTPSYGNNRTPNQWNSTYSNLDDFSTTTIAAEP